VRTLNYTSLPITGFAGIRERVLVFDRRYFSRVADDDVFDGFGDCVYLAHAYFTANGATGMHHHDDVDIISIFTKGCIEHKGSLGDGDQFQPGDVLIQCSGPNGFRHNEQNGLDDISGMVQIWCRPSEQSALIQQHKKLDISALGWHRIYGGLEKDDLTFIASHTQLDVLNIGEGQSERITGKIRLYVFDGELIAKEGDEQQTLKRGTLCDAKDLTLTSPSACQVLIQRTHDAES